MYKKYLTDEKCALHRGAIPSITEGGFKGVFVISGLSQAEDHLFAVEVITECLAQTSKWI